MWYDSHMLRSLKLLSQIVLVVIVGGPGLTSGACSQALIYGFGVGFFWVCVKQSLLILNLSSNREYLSLYLYSLHWLPWVRSALLQQSPWLYWCPLICRLLSSRPRFRLCVTLLLCSFSASSRSSLYFFLSRKIFFGLSNQRGWVCAHHVSS